MKTKLVWITLLILISIGCKKQELNSVSLSNPEISQIRLTGGPWYDAMERDRAWLQSLDPDRLLHHFHKVAGMEPKAPEYGGWEMEWRELRGHSIGHYLSAAARMQQLTGDTILMEKCNYTIQELAACQKKIGTGYLSAFPDEYLNRVEALVDVWAPYYTLHKILAGLLDGYLYLNSQTALETALGLSHYLYERIQPLGYEQFQKVLDHTEQGGMNELFWNLYAASGDSICRDLALAFYQESYFQPMLQKEDKLKGFHSNSLIPNVVGLAREYEMTGDISRKQVSEWFWNQIITQRSYVTGGTSNGEHWNTEPGHLETELGAGAHETCCTYNLIKLSGHIWGWNPDVKYQDYMERALINGILSTQNCETAMPMYYVSMATGYYKTWSTPDSSFWCCTGTGMENFARIAEYTYSTLEGRLYVNQFVSSELSYPEQGIKLIQETTMPKGNKLSLKIESEKPVSFKLAIRIPSWTDENYSISINGKNLSSKPAPGAYLMLEQNWKNGDEISLVFKPKLEYSLLPVNNDHVAISYGPLVLAASFGTPRVEEPLRHRYGPYDGTPVEVPVISFSTSQFEKYIDLIDPENLVFKMKDLQGNAIELRPFIDLLMESYSIYLPIEANATKSVNKTVDPSVHI